VDDPIPVFPLGTVLFPGTVLPLHIFEERYRLLVRDLLDGPEPRAFGVVAIELGHEVGPGAARRLADVGCTAVLRQVLAHEGGRFDIVTVGDTRFRISEVDDSRPYLRASVTPLPDEAGADPDETAREVDRLFRRYLGRLADIGAQVSASADLPDDPVRLSYAVAGALVVGQQEKQRLLEAADAAVRLRMEADLLTREILRLGRLPGIPATGFPGGGPHPN
jgi:hypothetical protein